MQHLEVQHVHLNGTNQISAVGKEYIGDYANSPHYIREIQNYLLSRQIEYIRYKVLGVYYDNPNEMPAESLRSFQGVFLSDDYNSDIPGLTRLTLNGHYLMVQVTGDINALFGGYGALINYAQQHQLTFISQAGYQVVTFQNGEMHTTIYMQVENTTNTTQS